MPRQFTLGSLFLVVALAAALIQGWLRHTRPVIYVRDYFVDIGPVTEGEVRLATFRLLNRGDGPIEVRPYLSACGADFINHFSTTVPPHGEASIDVVCMMRAGSTGDVVWPFAMHTTDPNQREIAFEVKGTVASQR